jgi:hypothetical protein
MTAAKEAGREGQGAEADHDSSSPRFGSKTRWCDWDARDAPVPADRAFIVVLAALSLSSCGPLPKGEHWKGSFIHLDPPRYSFAVPDGWREAKALDFSSLGFNRRMFATLEAASRSAFLLRAEIEMHGVDTGLISSRGAWIQIGSEPGSAGWYGQRDP